MKEKPYHNLSDGTFRNPKGSPVVISRSGKFSYRTFSKLGKNISLNFPNGLLYCCLSEAYAFLKGPIDMLTLYENKYKTEVQKFANEQVGRRRRDDYTDGAVRIPVNSANP